ncbi:MAG: adenine deaminase [Bacteroidia bacterium]
MQQSGFVSFAIMADSSVHTGFCFDLENSRLTPKTFFVKDGRITKMQDADSRDCNSYFLPGFIDAHVHIESSLLIPSEFARMAVIHGTVGTISDPHEIGNVMGIFGVEYMLRNSKKVPFYFFFGAPSCVPATIFETAGDEINLAGIEHLLKRDDIWYLAEVMNFPGVLNKDPEMIAKLDVAKKYNKPIDGHAPGLKGDDAWRYAQNGITTDHECFTLDEALDKIKAGMKIQIREGSAAKNFNALHPLLASYPEKVMFCSDDKHPDSLLEGHINLLVKRALNLGYDIFDVLRASSWNIKEHYNLPVGMLREGDSADFIEIDNTDSFKILSTYIKGECQAANGKTRIKSVAEVEENRFKSRLVKKEEFKVRAEGGSVKVIEALEGQLITNLIHHQLERNSDGFYDSDLQNDVLKIAVINRYKDAPIAQGFIKNFGLKKGAIASSVAHDSHNIVLVGCTDEDMCEAANLIMNAKGGLCAVNGNETHLLALPVAGLMSTSDGFKIAQDYITLDAFVKQKLGSTLNAPFMTLSFMALLVIPSLKLSDKGLFNGDTFEFTSLWNK